MERLTLKNTSNSYKHYKINRLRNWDSNNGHTHNFGTSDSTARPTCIQLQPLPLLCSVLHHLNTPRCACRSSLSTQPVGCSGLQTPFLPIQDGELICSGPFHFAQSHIQSLFYMHASEESPPPTSQTSSEMKRRIVISMILKWLVYLINLSCFDIACGN